MNYKLDELEIIRDGKMIPTSGTCRRLAEDVIAWREIAEGLAKHVANEEDLPALEWGVKGIQLIQAYREAGEGGEK